MSLFRSMRRCAGIVLCAGFWVGCQEASSSNQSNSEAVEPGAARVAVATHRPVDRVVTALGTFAAWSESVVSAKSPGRVAAIEVDLGSSVKAGDVLARIEARDYELEWRQALAALGQARARLGLSADGEDDSIDLAETTSVKEAGAMLDEALANRARILELSRQGIVSESERDAVEVARRVAQNRYDAAWEEARQRQAMVAQRRAEADIALERLKSTEIRAPFDGVVQIRHVHPGEFLQAGDPVVTLVAVDPLRLQVEAPEHEAARIRAGQKVRARPSGADFERETVVKRVSPALTERDRVLRVEADVPNQDGSLRAGAFARAEIVVEEGVDALVVPAEAIQVFAGLEKVFVVEDGRAREIEVRTGLRGDGWVEVTKGLEGGEKVALRPGGMRNGEAVQAIK